MAPLTLSPQHFVSMSVTSFVVGVFAEVSTQHFPPDAVQQRERRAEPGRAKRDRPYAEAGARCVHADDARGVTNLLQT